MIICMKALIYISLFYELAINHSLLRAIIIPLILIILIIISDIVILTQKNLFEKTFCDNTYFSDELFRSFYQYKEPKLYSILFIIISLIEMVLGIGVFLAFIGVGPGNGILLTIVVNIFLHYLYKTTIKLCSTAYLEKFMVGVLDKKSL